MSERKRYAAQARPPRRGLWWLAALLLGAVLLWLLLPGPPHGAFSVGELTFGTLRVGSVSDPQTVTLRNEGERGLRIKEIEFSGDAGAEFQIVEETCVARKLATGEDCEVRVTFAPRAAGDRSTRMVLDGNDRDLPSVGLVAVAVAPSLGFAPETVSFGTVALEAGPTSRTVTLSNLGTAPLEFDSIRIEGSAAGDFSRSRRCPSSTLSPGEACSFDIRFSPSVSGERSASLVVASDALGSPDSLALNGVGLWEGPPLDPQVGNLDLGEVQTAKRSAPKRLRFVNRTGGAVTVDKTEVQGSSSFAVVQDNCRGRMVPSGEGCSVQVTFLPVKDGGSEATLLLSAAGASETSRVPLRGRGVTPSFLVQTRTIDFGAQRAGFESAPKSASFKNDGTATLTPAAAEIEGSDFVVRADECAGKALAPGKSCEVGLGFSPSVSGPRQGRLIMKPGFGLSTSGVQLVGSGVVSSLAVSKSRLDFGGVPLGRTENRSLRLTNSGAARLELRGLRFEGADAASFRLTNVGCALDVGLAPGANCDISIVFESVAAKNYRAQLVLSYNGPDSPARVEVAGVGKQPAPGFRVSSQALALGAVPVGRRGDIRTLAISNPGAAWLSLENVSIRGQHAEDFSMVAGTCDGITALAPGGSCTVGVRFSPTAVGERKAAILIQHSAATGSATVELAGSGLALD